jgi:hypothetical protein
VVPLLDLLALQWETVQPETTSAAVIPAAWGRVGAPTVPAVATHRPALIDPTSAHRQTVAASGCARGAPRRQRGAGRLRRGGMKRERVELLRSG